MTRVMANLERVWSSLSSRGIRIKKEWVQSILSGTSATASGQSRRYSLDVFDKDIADGFSWMNLVSLPTQSPR